MADIFIPTIKQRTYAQLDVPTILNSLKTLADDRERAAQQRAALTGAMGQLRSLVHNDEYDYMAARQQEVNNQVNSLVDEGDYRGAIRYAQQAASDFVSDPAIQDRIKANTEYKKFVEQTQARNDIAQDVKDWAIHNNPYYYKDLTDDRGRVIGGTEWKPNFTPVTTVSLSQLSKMALDIAKPKTGSVNSVMFVKSDGTLTSTYEPGVEDVAWQTNGTWQRLGEKALRDALKAAIEMTPGAKESLHQDYEVARWQYDRLSEDERKNMIGSDIVDANGRTYTEDEYFEKRIRPWLTAAQINNTDYRTNYGNGIARLAERRAAQQAGLANAAKNISENTQFYAGGIPITYDNTDDYIIAKGEVNNAINDIAKSIPSLASKESWKNAVANNDVNTIINLTRLASGQLYKDSARTDNKDKVSKAMAALQNNKAWLEQTKNAIGKDNLDAIETQAAIYSGAELPANKYSRILYNSLDELNDGAGRDAALIGIRLTSEQDLNDMMSALSLNTNALKAEGVTVKHTDKHDIELVMDKNNPNIFKYLAYVGNNRYKFDSFWRKTVPGIRPTQITTYDNNGQKSSEQSIRRTTPHVTGMSYTGNVLKVNPIVDIANVVNNVSAIRTNVATSTVGGTSHTNTLEIFKIPELQEAMNLYGLNSEAYNKEQTRVMEDLHSIMAQANPAQGRIFTIDPNTKTLTQNLSQGDKIELWNDVAAVLADGSDTSNRVFINYGTDGVLHGYSITITPKDNAKGLEVLDPGKATQVFVVADNKFFTSNKMEEFKNDSGTRAIKEYNRRKLVDADYIDSFGTVITPFVGNGGFEAAYVDGRLVSKEEAEKLIEADIILNDLSTYEPLRDAFSTINDLLSQPPSEARDASLKQIRLAADQMAVFAAKKVLTNAGFTLPDPNNLDNPLNNEYNKRLSDYTNKIIEKAQ